MGRSRVCSGGTPGLRVTSIHHSVKPRIIARPTQPARSQKEAASAGRATMEVSPRGPSSARGGPPVDGRNAITGSTRERPDPGNGWAQPVQYLDLERFDFPQTSQTT